MSFSTAWPSSSDSQREPTGHAGPLPTHCTEGMNHHLKVLEDKTKEAVRLGQENEKEI